MVISTIEPQPHDEDSEIIVVIFTTLTTKWAGRTTVTSTVAGDGPSVFFENILVCYGFGCCRFLPEAQ